MAKIADAEGIKVEDDDLALEIEAMAGGPARAFAGSALGSRRKGASQSLATQLLERKVIDRILEDVEIEDVAVGHRARRPASRPWTSRRPRRRSRGGERQPEVGTTC